MDDEAPLLEITRWEFVATQDEYIPPEAWVEMFLTPLTSLGGKRIADILRERMGLDPIG